MFEHLTLADWLPVLVVAFVFCVGGVAFAWFSLRTGQYRDPEAAKYQLVHDDSYPDQHPGAERPS